MLRLARPLGRRLRHDRGAALFIVVLVLLALSGVGIYAAHAASTDVEVAGRYRQSHQTLQIAKLGMESSLSEVTRDPQTYLHAMTDTASALTHSACENEVTGLYDTGTKAFDGTVIDSTGCYVFTFNGVEAATGGGQLVARGDASTGVDMPSGIGPTTIRPDFAVEMTDKTSWDAPIKGFAAGTGPNMKFYTVTMTGRGFILPRDTASATTFGATDAATVATLSQSAGHRTSVQQIRAQVTIGPLPEGI